MKKKPQNKKNPAPWIVCIAVIAAVILARIVCYVAGVAWSDTLTRVFGGVELVAVAVLAYSVVRARQK